MGKALTWHQQTQTSFKLCFGESWLGRSNTRDLLDDLSWGHALGNLFSGVGCVYFYLGLGYPEVFYIERSFCEKT